jgi:vWA-MoxR associated protein C-terminal domain/Effector-associated domain 10
MSDLIQHIIDGNHTKEDLETLRQLLASSNSEAILQLGKYSVNVNGKDIHVGDRYQWDEKAIDALVKAIQENSGIHQNTQGGDAAAGNIDKSINFIQIICPSDSSKRSSKDFLESFDFSGVPQSNIKGAYQGLLNSDINLWDWSGNEIVQKLESHKDPGHLPEFFSRLVEDENLPREVRDRLQLFANQLVSNEPVDTTKDGSSSKSSFNQNEQIKSYLITTIVPDDDKFLLNAWLIIHDPFQDFSSFQLQDLTRFEPLLDENEEKAAISCNLAQIPAEFNKLLQKAVGLLRRKKYYLTIEFFLPSSLMCIEIDRWKIKINDSDEIVLGTKYPVRLRAVERLEPLYLDYNWNQWCENWEKVRISVKDKPTEDLFEHLHELDSCCFDRLTYKLNDKIGLKVTCTHDRSVRRKLFTSIRLSMTPIAVWIRSDIPTIDRATEIDKILTLQPLKDLCKSVRETRIQAHTQVEEHLGLHLALLWENPYRLTPPAIVALRATRY